MKRILTAFLAIILLTPVFSQQAGFKLNDLEYFENGGVNVMSFQDFYPEGHQGGISIIMHGQRLVTNGDLRLDETPGQWQPVPKQQKRMVDPRGNVIVTNLTYPDSALNRKGFNPIFYPDLYFNYTVKTRAEGSKIIITVDLDRPIPDEFIGKVGFNMELFPGVLFGKTWIMDEVSGIFPRQANGPAMYDKNNELVAAYPMAKGKKLVVAPEDGELRLSITSKTGGLQLIDGRYLHNNGWFVVRGVVPENTTTNVIEWEITPNIVDGWTADPVIQVSQVGYRPEQQKFALVEVDKNDDTRNNIELLKVNSEGVFKTVQSVRPEKWGRFLRYDYLKFDFTSVTEPGLYFVKYGNQKSHPFRIGEDIFKRHVWQPTLEYFLPVQMCHMRVSEKYRVWHGLCHMDDALMAPVNHNHFDGYIQGESTLTDYKPGDHVPGLNIGGWHDAGDYDIRIETQSGEVYILIQAYEEFRIDYDETFIDQHTRIVEIHQPDGKPDILQQIEHGALSIVAGYKNLGRLYRGIIVPTQRQYVHLGDGSTMTDGLVNSPSPADDRWVFTDNNYYDREPDCAGRELTVAAQMAAATRVLKGFNDTLALQCLELSEDIFNLDRTLTDYAAASKIHAATELFRTTGKQVYKDYLIKHKDLIIKKFSDIGWLVGDVIKDLGDESFTQSIEKAAVELSSRITREGEETPFGVPYQPDVFGAGWDLQKSGVEQYFLHKFFPEIFPADYLFNVLNFILGVHPGSNTSSFASGVGSKSLTVAYGANRADWSYIPGGVPSGTGIVRPDFPELLDWPFLWQQKEYVMGGGATNFMFLVLAADYLSEKN